MCGETRGSQWQSPKAPSDSEATYDFGMGDLEGDFGGMYFATISRAHLFVQTTKRMGFLILSCHIDVLYKQQRSFL